MTRIDPIEASPEQWAGQSSWHADVRDCDYGAKRDGYAGTGVHFEPTVHHGFSARFNGVGAFARAPVGAIEQLVSDGHYRYASRSSQAGASRCYEHAVRDDWGTRAKKARAAEYNRYAEQAGNGMSITGLCTWGSLAGIARQCMSGGPYKPATRNGRRQI